MSNKTPKTCVICGKPAHDDDLTAITFLDGKTRRLACVSKQQAEQGKESS